MFVYKYLKFYAMKKLFLLLSVLSLGITSLFLVYSCSDKEDEELMTNITVESESQTSNKTLAGNSTCDSSCFFSSCNASCPDGQTAYCECDWGFASCGCRSGSGNDKVVIAPSYSMEQLNLVISYTVYLSNHGLDEIAESVELIKANLIDGNTDEYYNSIDT